MTILTMIKYYGFSALSEYQAYDVTLPEYLKLTKDKTKIVIINYNKRTKPWLKLTKIRMVNDESIILFKYVD